MNRGKPKSTQYSLLMYDRLLHAISSCRTDQDVQKGVPKAMPTSAHAQTREILCKHPTTIPVPAAEFFQHCKDNLVTNSSPGQSDDDADGHGGGQLWKCEGVGMQPVVELPSEYGAYFDAPAPQSSSFYMSKYAGSTGVWYAVLFALDAEFIMRTFQNQQNCVVALKQQMNSELDSHYTLHKYRQYGYSKADMHRVLMNSDTYNAFMGHYLSDFFQLNVAVLMPNSKYHWLGRFDPTRVTLCLYHQGTDWCPIVHADGATHLLAAVPWLSELEHLDYMDSSKQHLNLAMDKATLSILKREIKGMKIRNLQDRALELELLIHDSYGRKKLKAELQEEVFVQMTGCESLSL
jgi:hypothetical protein